MQQRTIGDWAVSAIGYGALWLSESGRPPVEQARAVVAAALDSGITLIDTADAYCRDDTERGHNERLVAQALHAYSRPSAPVLIATKGGYRRPGGAWVLDGRPASLRAACEASLQALGVETIDLYQLHAPDPRVPFEESVGALADLRRAGKVRMIGLSNVTPAQLERAERIVLIASVQNECNHWTRGDETNGLLSACAAGGIAYLAYSPLGGSVRATDLGRSAPIAAAARRHNATPQQVVLAWLLAKSPVLIPIPGSRHSANVRRNAAASDLVLGAEELAALDAATTPGHA